MGKIGNNHEPDLDVTWEKVRFWICWAWGEFQVSVYRGKVKPRNQVRHWARGIDLCPENSISKGSPITSVSKGKCPWFWTKRKMKTIKRDRGVLAELTHTWVCECWRERYKQKNDQSSDDEETGERSLREDHPNLSPGLHWWGCGRLSYFSAHIH